MQRGQGRDSVRLLREEGEQGLRGHVGPSEAKVGLLLLIRQRWPLRRRDLLPSAARRGELRQQRAYHRRVHCASGATVDGVRASCLRARARQGKREREEEEKSRLFFVLERRRGDQQKVARKESRWTTVFGLYSKFFLVNSLFSVPRSLSRSLAHSGSVLSLSENRDADRKRARRSKGRETTGDREKERDRARQSG